MLKNSILLILVILFISCSTSGYYDIRENTWNKEEAIRLVKDLKTGTLIVQIPTERRKSEVMLKMISSEKDAAKKALKQQEYYEFKKELSIIQKTLITSIQTDYSFSKYAFVPDSLIKTFKTGIRENVFINEEFKFVNNIEFEDAGSFLYLRSHRDFDDLFFHKEDGSFAPKPFPYQTSISTLEVPAEGTHLPFKRADTKTLIKYAIGNLDKKLNKFYNSIPNS